LGACNTGSVHFWWRFYVSSPVPFILLTPKHVTLLIIIFTTFHHSFSIFLYLNRGLPNFPTQQQYPFFLFVISSFCFTLPIYLT
jgi:hypothetical protein